MEAQGRTRPTSRVGYAITLVGCAGFVASVLLPIEHLHVGGRPQTLSFYRLLMGGPNSLTFSVGGLFELFAGVTIVGLVAVIGLRGTTHGCLPPVLASVVAAWSLTWAGKLFHDTGGSIPSQGEGWMLLSIGVVVVGTLVVVVSSFTARRRPPITTAC